MRTIQSIYETYRVPPNLQLHMYRVAALGMCMADHMSSDLTLNKNIITQANLLHDIGNIVKFDFSLSEAMGMPEDEVSYWKGVQTEVITKYGKDEDIVTDRMVEELGVDKRVIDILTQHGLDKIKYALAHDDWDAKIIRYCDSRISPNGVVSISQRWADNRKRYQGRNHALSNLTLTEARENSELELEEQIQSKCAVDLQAISNQEIEARFPALKMFEI